MNYLITYKRDPSWFPKEVAAATRDDAWRTFCDSNFGEIKPRRQDYNVAQIKGDSVKKQKWLQRGQWARMRRQLEKIVAFNGRHPDVFVDERGVLSIGSEDGWTFCDYYGEHKEPLWIDERIIAIAERFGAYWEWQNPSRIGAYLK